MYYPLASNIENNSNVVTERDQVVSCNEIDSLAVNGNETAGLTTFVQEACDSVEVLGSHYIRPRVLNEQGSLQDLKAYFARPRLISNGNVTAGFRGSLFNDDVNITDLFNNDFPNGRVRLQGVFGVRFKLVYTLQVSATPFHQGLLVLNWQYGATSTATSSSYPLFKRSAQPYTTTNLPHVRLDLSTTTMTTFSVPFLHHTEFMELTPGGGSSYDLVYGLLNLTAVLPSQTVANMNAATYKLYVHLEDLEFYGAFPAATSTITLQSGKQLKPMDKEFEQDAYPFSSSLSAMSRSIRFLGKGIPMISSIAGTTSWFMAKTAGAVRAYGFSKPQIQEPIMRVNAVTTVGEGNVDLPSATMVVGPFAGNSLKVDPSVGATEVDEMSLSYVLSQFSQICYGTLTTTLAHGTTLYATNVSPSVFWYRAPASAPFCNITPPTSITTAQLTASGGTIMPSNVMFVSSMFRNWRGGFKFRFTFAKTKMHAGRVMAMFVPNSSSATLGTAVGPEVNSGLTQPFGYSAIFDLKDDNVFEFTVPFISPLPNVAFRESIGSLTLTVLDPLVASAVVTTSVPFMVEVAAMDDFEPSIYCGTRFTGNVVNVIRLQSGKELSTGKSSLVHTIDERVAETTVGEAFTSFKQLLMIPKWTDIGYVPSNSLQQICVPPWWYLPVANFPVNQATTPSFESFSTPGMISKCYQFARGANDVHVYAPPGGNLNGITMWASPSNADYSSAAVTTADPLAATWLNVPPSGQPRVFSVGNHALHVRFPAHQKFIRMKTWAIDQLSRLTPWSPKINNANKFFDLTTIADSGTAASPVVPRVVIYNPTSSNQPAFFFGRCAGDDAMLAHFMGPIPLHIPSTGTAGSYGYDVDWAAGSS